MTPRRYGLLLVLLIGGVAPASPALRAQVTGDATTKAITDLFSQYDAAFNAKDLDRLGTFYHPEVTVYEGGGINTGWPDYRDNHLGPELKSYTTVKFAHSIVSVHVVGPEAAYVTSEYSIAVTTGDRQSTSGGLETDVLVRQGNRWLIRHTHTSARRRAGSS
jgi:uncharacterized protein (TIGR02246 family)